MKQSLSKPAARARGKAVRAALSAPQKAQLDRRIVSRCQETLQWAGLKRVHLFVPIPRMKEIDTWPLLEWIWEQYPGLEAFVPRVVGHVVEHVAVTRSTKWVPNAFGIPEPVGGTMLGASEALDVVLVPLLACDSRGYRVGYGGGYYDRFLQQHAVGLRVGLVYDECLLPENITDEAHDIALQVVITDRQVLRVAAA